MEDHSFLANSSLPSNDGSDQYFNGSGYLNDEAYDQQAEQDTQRQNQQQREGEAERQGQGQLYQQQQQQRTSRNLFFQGNILPESHNYGSHAFLDQEYAEDEDEDDPDYQESGDESWAARGSGTTSRMRSESSWRDDDDMDDGEEDNFDDDDDDDDEDNYDDEDDEDELDLDNEEGDDDEEELNSVEGQEMFTKGLKELENLGLVDIGNLASWTASSFKSDSGVKEVRDDSPYTFWQSEGELPHYIQIHFTKRVSIERLSIYVDLGLDESYTPNKIQIYAGNGEHDLMKVLTREFGEPRGWQHITFRGVRRDNLLKAYLIKVKILSNHQNGRDSHVRALKVMVPVANSSRIRQDIDDLGVGFTSIKLMSESTLR